MYYKKEVLPVEAKQYFIYLFRVKKTGDVIYVGSTKAIGKRLNQHRRAFKEPKHELPIHAYMKENHLSLFDDVEVCIVEYLPGGTKEQVLEIEAKYYYKYKDTIKNTRPAEIRSGEFSVRNKSVKCLNDGNVFISIRKAAEYYGMNRVTLMYHLNKGTILKSGLVFEYVNQENAVGRSLYKICCIEDERYFSTLKSCAEFYGMTQQQISNRLRNGDSFMFCGKHFERCNDYRKPKEHD